MSHKLEYIWLDGCTPTQLRSKTKIVKSFGRDGGEAPSQQKVDRNNLLLDTY
jgi:hypothetical protein